MEAFESEFPSLGDDARSFSNRRQKQRERQEGKPKKAKELKSEVPRDTFEIQVPSSSKIVDDLEGYETIVRVHEPLDPFQLCSPAANRVRCKRVHRLARGSTIRYVLSIREAYKRTDQPCLSLRCGSCDQTSAFLAATSTHYVLPHVDALCLYLDLFVNQEHNVHSVVFAQTVLRKLLLERGRKAYQSVMDFVKCKKNSVVYLNDVSDSTFIERTDAAEPLDHWRFRCLYKLAEFYVEHLDGVSCVIATEDEILRNICGSANPKIFVLSTSKYFALFYPSNSELRNLHASLFASANSGEASNEEKYQDYIPHSQLQGLLVSGDCIQGVLRVNARKSQSDAYVSSSRRTEWNNTTDVESAVEPEEMSVDSDIFISGQWDRNRAVHGDRVIVRLKPKSDWITDGKSAKRTGFVVAIVQRCWRDFVCTMSRDEKGQRRLFVPYDYRIPKIRVAVRDGDNLAEQRVLVKIDSWPRDSQYPNGHIARGLGPVGCMKVETDVIMIENGFCAINDLAFTPEQLASLPHSSQEIQEQISSSSLVQGNHGRKDLRDSHLIFSIDPPGCEDIDDALSVRRLANGQLELGIHIADVTHFVPVNSPLDKAAERRSTTVYLVNHRVDMLPALLSADLCSLWSGKDRFAVSVIVCLSPRYEIVDVWFGRTIIRSAYKLEYSVAQKINDGVILPEDTETLGLYIRELWDCPPEIASRKACDLAESIGDLVNIAAAFSDKRGGLELESTEVGFDLVEEGNVEGMKAGESILMHEVIAECMILANRLVAEKMASAFPEQAILRRHPAPTDVKLAALEQAMAVRGFKLDAADNRAFAASLNRAVDPSDSIFNETVRNLAVFSMEQATYVKGTKIDTYHYGLALERYTHFTSPIRRYADVIVHRQLLAACNSADSLSFPVSNEVCEHMNQKHRCAKAVQRASVEWFQARFFDQMSENDVRRIAEGIIYKLGNDCFGVMLPTWGIRGMVFLQDCEIVKTSDAVIQFLSDGQAIALNLFDHVLVKVTVEKTLYHADRLRLSFINKVDLADSSLNCDNLPVKISLLDIKDDSAVTDNQITVLEQYSKCQEGDWLYATFSQLIE